MSDPGRLFTLTFNWPTELSCEDRLQYLEQTMNSVLLNHNAIGTLIFNNGTMIMSIEDKSKKTVIRNVNNSVINNESLLEKVHIQSLKDVTIQLNELDALEENHELTDEFKKFRDILYEAAETHQAAVDFLADELQKVVKQADKPPKERDLSFLKVTADGLTSAARAVKNIMPDLMEVATRIARLVSEIPGK